MATCTAMANITDMLNGPSVTPNETDLCLLSADCLEITCSTDGGLGDNLLFQMILLPCFSPPAVRIVYVRDDATLDHIFRQSESSAVTGSITRFNVTLDHKSDAIGLQASPPEIAMQIPTSLPLACPSSPAGSNCGYLFSEWTSFH